MVTVQHQIVELISGEGRIFGWRLGAARLAAGLLCVVSPAAADEILDLRSALLDAAVSPAGVLKAFFAARNRLENEHYLLFYRLRRVLEPALGVEISAPGVESVRRGVDFRFRDTLQMRRSLQREWFEHHLSVSAPSTVKVAVIWRFQSTPSREAPQVSRL